MAKVKDLELQLNELKLSFENVNKLFLETNARINDLIFRSNSAFANISNGMLELSNKKNSDDKLQIRQFCVQAAALCCQREGGDIIQTANRIHDYVIDNPAQAIPHNLVSILSNKN